jgi:diguanylate cyclase (GGDEF)-like protein
MESIATPARVPEREPQLIPDARGNTLICSSPESGSGAIGPQTTALIHYLIAVRGGIPGTMFRLKKGMNCLGRGAENTVQVYESSVSRHHALITVDPCGTALLTDVGSTNGTFMDGRRILANRAVRVPDATRIQLGPSVILKYVKLDPYDAGFHHELFERSVRDNLTGLYNRSYFLGQVGPLADLNATLQLGLAILLIDVDHFKKVNDTHGHEVGDRVLKHVSDVLRESTRAEDLVARYGGEEFVIALPCTTVEQAIDRAERIRCNIANACIDASGRTVSMTASLGLSFCAPGRARNLTQLISEADEALYLAKNRGRNRVIISSRGAMDETPRTDSAEGFVVL